MPLQEIKSPMKANAGEGQRRLSKLKVAPLALVGALVLVVTVVAVSARTCFRPIQPVTTAAGFAPKDQDNQSPQLPPDVVLTTLGSDGFAPPEMTHAAGQLRIVIQNKSEVKNLDLRLDQEQSSRWQEHHVLGEIQGWIANVELAAGTYTVTEANHPGWVCHLTVQ